MSRVFPKVRNTKADPDLRTGPMSRVFPKVRNTEADPDLWAYPIPRVVSMVRLTVGNVSVVIKYLSSLSIRLL